MGDNTEKKIRVSFFYEESMYETRFDVYETLCPQQMLVHKGGQIKNWSGECNLQNCSVKLFKEHLKVQICKRGLFEKNKIFFF